MPKAAVVAAATPVAGRAPRVRDPDCTAMLVVPFAALVAVAAVAPGAGAVTVSGADAWPAATMVAAPGLALAGTRTVALMVPSAAAFTVASGTDVVPCWKRTTMLVIGDPSEVDDVDGAHGWPTMQTFTVPEQCEKPPPVMVTVWPAAAEPGATAMVGAAQSAAAGGALSAKAAGKADTTRSTRRTNRRTAGKVSSRGARTVHRGAAEPSAEV